MKIAIKANPSRGKEIISLLESLGGINDRGWIGDACIDTYYIDKNNMIRHDYAPIDYEVYTLEEFETQFPFKIGDLCIYSSDAFGDVVVKILGMTIKDDCIMYEVGHKDITKEHSYIYRKRETLKPYKEMKEERNITLTLDKAKEWYKKGGELKEIALQAFSEKELNPLPRSWEEFCEKYPVKRGECILESRDTIRSIPCDCNGNRVYKNWIPSKRSAEAHLAMIQLEQLRNCWWGDWRPEWNDDQQTKYCIVHSKEFKIHILHVTRYFLSFPTIEMAKEFLECFRDLIEKAGDLI